MNNGLSAGIVNPSSEPMMSAYYSFNALIGEDEQCMAYIANASQTADSNPARRLPKKQCAYAGGGNYKGLVRKRW